MEQIHLGKVGLFGGTFDPIHFGHLNMAEELMKAKNLEEVWLCPAFMNPHKIDQQSAPIGHRLKMVQLAISDQPRFKLLDVEAKRKGPSYTVDTLRQLVAEEQARPSPRRIHLIISDELALDFFHWHKPQEIIRLASLLIGSRLRSSKKPPPLEGDPCICRAIESGWTPTSVKGISSTEIRRKLSKGLNCEFLVPRKVLDYIYQNNLYSTV
ncbi:MAG: nicotinate (nicotinamide) nucleotide adenylyltransferase [Waddliaceae bacterium]